MILPVVIALSYPFVIFATMVAKDFWDLHQQSANQLALRDAQRVTRRIFKKSTLNKGHILTIGSRCPNNFASGKDFQVSLDGYPLEGITDFQIEVNASGDMAKAKIEMFVRLADLTVKL